MQKKKHGILIFWHVASYEFPISFISLRVLIHLSNRWELAVSLKLSNKLKLAEIVYSLAYTT